MSSKMEKRREELRKKLLEGKKISLRIMSDKEFVDYYSNGIFIPNHGISGRIHSYSLNGQSFTPYARENILNKLKKIKENNKYKN